MNMHLLLQNPCFAQIDRCEAELRGDDGQSVWFAQVRTSWYGQVTSAFVAIA